MRRFTMSALLGFLALHALATQIAAGLVWSARDPIGPVHDAPDAEG